MLLKCFKRKKDQYFTFFISRSYFEVPKTIKLYATHYFIMKIPNKRDLQQIESNRFSEFGFEDFIVLYKDYTKEPYSFLVKDTTLSSDNPLQFRKNVLQMSISEKIKTIDSKIDQNKTWYDLDRQTAKISALSSEKLVNISFWLANMLYQIKNYSCYNESIWIFTFRQKI